MADDAQYDADAQYAASTVDRWAATPRRLRVAMIAALVALVLAAGLTVRAVGAKPRTITRTVTLPAAAAAPTVDATGCPTTRTCVVGVVAGASFAAVRDRFPAARLVSVTSTADSRTHHVYQRLVVVSLGDGDVLLLWAQSVPGGRVSADSVTHSTLTRHGFGQETIVASQLTTVRHGVGAGRTVRVETDTAGPVAPDQRLLRQLATDDRVRLP